MATKAGVEYRKKRGLVETTEPGFERPLWRKPGFDGVVSLDEMDNAISAFIAQARTNADLTRDHLAELLGISPPVYGRYEKAEARLNVTRLVHLCEILGFDPAEMIYAAAPHLYGDTPQQAQNRIALLRLIARLRPEVVDSLLLLIGEMSGEDNSGDRADG